MSVPEPGPASAPAPRRSRSRLFVLVAGALALLAGIFTVLLTTISGGGGAATAAAPSGLRQVKHVVVIYLENWSFDSLYGNFPGADGLAQAAAAPPQVNKKGKPYATLPQPLASAPGATPTNPAVAENSAVAKPAAVRPPDRRFPANLPNAPFPIFSYVSPFGKTADPGRASTRSRPRSTAAKWIASSRPATRAACPSATTTPMPAPGPAGRSVHPGRSLLPRRLRRLAPQPLLAHRRGHSEMAERPRRRAGPGRCQRPAPARRGRYP